MKHLEDMFHVTELYLLAAAFRGEKIFGLPDKRKFQLQGSDVFEQANKSLIEKEILTPDGKITKGGAYVIRALEFYYWSKKFVRINNLMFGFIDKDKQEVIVLAEVEDQAYYRLYVMSKMHVLKLLMERFPFMSRQPAAKEKEFLTKELPSAIALELAEYDAGEDLLNLEVFHIEEQEVETSVEETNSPSIFRELNEEVRAGHEVNEDILAKGDDHEVNNEAETHSDQTETKVTLGYQYEQWLIFSKDDQLYMVDPLQNKYYQASQYWFMKVLFDEMEFPYKEVATNG